MFVRVAGRRGPTSAEIRAFLSDGPPTGMEVVTQGASELYAETDVEE